MSIAGLSEEALLGRVRELQSSIYRLDTFANSVIMDTLASVKLSRMSVRRLGARTALMNDAYVQKRAAQPFKRYEGVPQFDLGDYADVELTVGLSNLARSRKSTKDYAAVPLSLMHMSAILQYTYGVMREEEIHEARVRWRFRPTPSPGGLFATELYFVAINTDLPSGLYHYRPDIHALEQVRTGQFAEFVGASCGVDTYLDSAAKLGGMMIFTSIIERLFIKYGERTLKFMMIETGLIAQQMSLTVEALGLGSCMLGAYYDDEVHEFLGIDGVLECVNNVMAIGHKRAAD